MERENVEFFCLNSPPSNYNCILSARTYFTGKGQKTVNKYGCFACKRGKTPTNLFFSAMSASALHKGNITHCKCTITWVAISM